MIDIKKYYLNELEWKKMTFWNKILSILSSEKIEPHELIDKMNDYRGNIKDILD